mgnify:FL=1
MIICNNTSLVINVIFQVVFFLFGNKKKLQFIENAVHLIEKTCNLLKNKYLYGGRIQIIVLYLKCDTEIVKALSADVFLFIHNRVSQNSKYNLQKLNKVKPLTLFKTYIITCINNQLNIFIMKKVVLSISAMLFVGAMSFAQSNMSNVNQVGNLNGSIVNQNGGYNDADVDQIGRSNSSEVYQGIRPSLVNAMSNSAEVLQRGKSNVAFISQSNQDNEAFQKQIGDNNRATIWQDQVTGAPGATQGSDWAKQVQRGDNNVATVDQGTSGNERPQAPSVFSAAQLASVAAVAVPVSPHKNNKALQTQTGDGNTAYASQGGIGNKSYQTQTSPSGTSVADGNVSNHYQYGNRNVATLTQNGTKLLENTMQIGNRNDATISQTGMGHQAVGFSLGNSNSISITQSGM